MGTEYHMDRAGPIAISVLGRNKPRPGRFAGSGGTQDTPLPPARLPRLQLAGPGVGQAGAGQAEPVYDGGPGPEVRIDANPTKRRQDCSMKRQKVHEPL